MESLTLQDTIAANLAALHSRLGLAAARAGREPSSIRLIAVSKTFPIAYVRAARAAGQTEFGENRLQEALEKIGLSSDMSIKWHLVGHLQSNKARRAAESFACIHSVDSSDLLRRVDAAAAQGDHHPEVLIQVDLAGEPAKFGATAEALPSIFEEAAACRAVQVVGLMVLPPFTPDPEGARPFFRGLRDIRDELAGRGIPLSMLRELSMGMSHDFEVAVEEGATLVRVGTALFGTR